MSTSRTYEVALSFAGEDRAYVDMVARFLRQQGVSLFYDAYEQTDLWGKDLYAHLSEVYSNTSRFVVMFISQHYAAKNWTTHERRAAQARALQERQEYILPVRFDDTPVAGLLPTTFYLDARRISPEMLASKILEKLGRPILLAKANAVPAPHNPALSGSAQFNFRSYDGRFEIGTDDVMFETRWSAAGSESIHAYTDAPSIRGLALVPPASKDALRNVAALDYTSRVRTPHVGQCAVWQNVKGFYAVTLIEAINGDELRFRYWINTDGSANFSEVLQ